MSFNKSETPHKIYYANYDNQIAVNVNYDFEYGIWRDRKGHRVPAYAWNETINEDVKNLLETGKARPRESIIFGVTHDRHTF